MKIPNIQNLLKQYGEWDIKLKMNELTKKKIRLSITLIANILVAYVISMIVYFVMALFLENRLSVLIESLNYEVYYWIVNNRNIVVYIYVGIVMAVVIYRFISKYVNANHEVYNALDLILKEDNETIKLPSEVNKFSEKINEIKYDYILTKKSEREAEQKKNDLIVYMAHDLKTPLTSIIGYLTLLKDEKQISKELQEKYIKIALDKALRVEELTNQFFDITRYNLQKMPINKQKINLVYLLKQVIDECYPMLEKRNLKCDFKSVEKVMYVGDGDKLARAFDKIKKNAINYSYENTTIEIQLEQQEGKISIVFRNKGDKIPQYKLDKLFEKFYRGDDARTSSTGGAGLGLAITKQIIELHQGKIYVKNDDEYIEFFIEL